MTIDLHSTIAYFTYWLTKYDEYAIQSSTIFGIYEGLKHFVATEHPLDSTLEATRRLLLEDVEILSVSDFGAGSKKLKNRFRKTSEITYYSTSNRKYNKLYQYFCLQTPAMTVLELGTCTGINAQFLAACTMGTVYTMEGSQAIWQKAKEKNQFSNIHFHLGEIKKELPHLLQSIAPVDFALIDATHTCDATFHYFNLLLPYMSSKSILAIADIHWSADMEKAWQIITKHPAVSLKLDFFECGIVYLDQSMPKISLVLDI